MSKVECGCLLGRRACDEYDMEYLMGFCWDEFDQGITDVGDRLLGFLKCAKYLS